MLEGSSPYGLATMSQHRALEIATFSGMPVARVGRADPGGRVPSGWDDLTIAGSNLDTNKARLLMMASMLKLGRLPKARDPRNPTKAERAATVAAVARFQDIFESHYADRLIGTDGNCFRSPSACRRAQLLVDFLAALQAEGLSDERPRLLPGLFSIAKRRRRQVQKWLRIRVVHSEGFQVADGLQKRQ